MSISFLHGVKIVHVDSSWVTVNNHGMMEIIWQILDAALILLVLVFVVSGLAAIGFILWKLSVVLIPV